MMAGTLGLAPMSHADPNSFYLDCLTQHGIVITDTANAVNLGVLIQQAEMNQTPYNVLQQDLETQWGESPRMAQVDMMCAAMTLRHGS